MFNFLKTPRRGECVPGSLHLAFIHTADLHIFHVCCPSALQAFKLALTISKLLSVSGLAHPVCSSERSYKAEMGLGLAIWKELCRGRPGDPDGRVWASSVPLHQRKPGTHRAALARCSLSAREVMILLPSSQGGLTRNAPSVLGSSVQEAWTPWSKSSKGSQRWVRDGSIWQLRGHRESSSCQARRALINPYRHLMGGSGEDGARLFLVVRREAVGTHWNGRNSV